MARKFWLCRPINRLAVHLGDVVKRGNLLRINARTIPLNHVVEEKLRNGSLPCFAKSPKNLAPSAFVAIVVALDEGCRGLQASSEDADALLHAYGYPGFHVVQATGFAEAYQLFGFSGRERIRHSDPLRGYSGLPREPTQRSSVHSIATASPCLFGLHCPRHQSECVDIGPAGRISRLTPIGGRTHAWTEEPAARIHPGARRERPLTFDTIAQAYLEDYVLQRYRTLTTARARVEHLRGVFRRLGRRGHHAGQCAQLSNAPAATGG